MLVYIPYLFLLYGVYVTLFSLIFLCSLIPCSSISMLFLSNSILLSFSLSSLMIFSRSSLVSFSFVIKDMAVSGSSPYKAPVYIMLIAVNLSIFSNKVNSINALIRNGSVIGFDRYFFICSSDSFVPSCILNRNLPVSLLILLSSIFSYSSVSSFSSSTGSSFFSSLFVGLNCPFR